MSVKTASVKTSSVKTAEKKRKPKYQLLYFDDSRARAECIRLAFAAANIPIDDVRVSIADWAQIKSEQPMRQLPVLRFGNEVLCQSRAILNFVAREFNMYGGDNLEMSRVDQFIGCTEDLLEHVKEAIMEQDDAKQRTKVKNLKEKILPKLLGYLEKMAKKDIFIVGDTLTIADLVWFDAAEKMKEIGENLDDYERLKASVDKVKLNPGVSRYLESRPRLDLDSTISES